MRSLFRLLAPVLAAATIALAGATSVLASSPSSMSLDANWCYQSGTTEYCYDIDGSVTYHDTGAGSSVVVHTTTRTTVFESGQYAGETRNVSISRETVREDGTVVIQTVMNTRSTVGGEPCTYRLVLRLVDYEATVFHTTQTCV